MKVGPRLFLSAVVLPSVGTLLMVLIAGQVFERALMRDLDRRLLAQAAVESVSLFDGPGGFPHLHVEESQLPPEIRAAAATAAVYDHHGRKLLQSPAEDTAVPATLTERGVVGRPSLHTTQPGSDQRRQLILGVRAPDGHNYSLWLSSRMSSIAFTLGAFYRVSLLGWAVFALALLILQRIIARRITLRIADLVRILPRLWTTPFVPPPATDSTSADELTELRSALFLAAQRVAEAQELRSRFVANAAHELRTPLTLMRTEIDLALRKQRSDVELRTALTEIRDEVDRLAALAERLLEIESLPRRSPVQDPIDLVSIARASIDAFAASASQIQVTITLDGVATAPLRGDATALRQAADNLLSNAIKFAPAGSRITVTVASAPGNSLRLIVQDEGPGIPDTERDRVFQPFERAPDGTKGAGLGLAIVKEIATLHGGHAFVDSSPRGARVVVEVLTSYPNPISPFSIARSAS